MQSSLSVLRPGRLERLARTGCVYTAPSIESWWDYGDKARTGRRGGEAKLREVVAHLLQVARAVPGVQVNQVVGLDSEDPDALPRLCRGFVKGAPEVLHTLILATPYGGTPLYVRLLREGRILEDLPPAFYHAPFVAMRPPNESAGNLFRRFRELLELVTSTRVQARRFTVPMRMSFRLLHAFRSIAARPQIRELRALDKRWREDAAFRRFHETGRGPVPAFYHVRLDRDLGPYAALYPREARRPRHHARSEALAV